MLLIIYSLLLRLNTIHLDEAIRFFKQTTIITFTEIIMAEIINLLTQQLSFALHNVGKMIEMYLWHTRRRILYLSLTSGRGYRNSARNSEKNLFEARCLAWLTNRSVSCFRYKWLRFSPEVSVNINARACVSSTIVYKHRRPSERDCFKNVRNVRAP